MEKLNKCSATFDIVLLLPFLIPSLNSYVIDFLFYLHNYFALGGEFTQFNSTNLIFVSLLSAVSIMWGMVRFIKPSRFNLLSDTIIRFCIAGLISCFVFLQNASLLFSIFILSELSIGIIQLLSAKSARASEGFSEKLEIDNA